MKEEREAQYPGKNSSDKLEEIHLTKRREFKPQLGGTETGVISQNHSCNKHYHSHFGNAESTISSVYSTGLHAKNTISGYANDTILKQKLLFKYNVC